MIGDLDDGVVGDAGQFGSGGQFIGCLSRSSRLGYEKILLLSACLLALGSITALAQVATTTAESTAGSQRNTMQPEAVESVTLKVYETSGALQLILTRSTGQPEIHHHSAKELKLEGAAEAFTQQVLVKLYQEGFVLKDSFGGDLGMYTTSNTLVFKKQK